MYLNECLFYFFIYYLNLYYSDCLNYVKMYLEFNYTLMTVSIFFEKFFLNSWDVNLFSFKFLFWNIWNKNKQKSNSLLIWMADSTYEFLSILHLNIDENNGATTEITFKIPIHIWSSAVFFRIQTDENKNWNF